MTIKRWIALSLTTMCLTAWGQVQPDKHYPITPRQVARALSNYGMQTGDEQVSLAVAVLSSETYPALDILSVEPQPKAGNGQPLTTVKVACHATASCLPFVATIAGPQPVVTPATNLSAATATTLSPKTKPTFTMRTGSHAVLFLDDQVAHIQIAVVSLENGDTGHWIRVVSPDHKQYYRAEVVSPSELRGDF